MIQIKPHFAGKGDIQSQGMRIKKPLILVFIKIKPLTNKGNKSHQPIKSLVRNK